ncbi:MAG: glyceraldehyde 3-phosphate dehydrogenase NAD-binding domain-containing protein, partial [Candidatus Puniceispirillales bacterium]
MTIRLGINGFGRIGRNVMRAVIEENRTDIEVVAINISGSIETNAHLLRYDSVHGRFQHPVTITDQTMDVGKGPMRITSTRNIAELDWAEVGVDIVLECTGAFNSRDKAIEHTAVGAKKVLVS